MAITILHMSDVHLGNDWIPRAILTLRPWWKPVDKGITAGLIEVIRETKPDYIVLSGDIVNKPQKAMFEKAAHYLRSVFTDAGFDFMRRLLVVAGNHDVGFFPQKQPDDSKRLKNYRGFLQALYGENDVENRMFHFVHHDAGLRVIFACLDSTMRDRAPLAEGEIGGAQRQWLRSQIRKLREQLGEQYHSYIKIAVLHHHCVPIAGTPPKSERFMQLLDAADTLELLDESEFQVALHGHKHVPHQHPLYRSDSSVLTVIGAGTATCVFLEDQQGFGNNVNLITIDPEGGRLGVQLARADQNGQFKTEDPKYFPLFRIPPLGYSAESVSSVSTLSADGRLIERLVKSNLSVANPPKQINELKFFVSASAASAKIADVTPDTPDAILNLETQQDHLWQGTWKLKKTLEFRSVPIKIAYSYAIEHGTAMSVKEYHVMYTSGDAEEYTSVIIIETASVLRMEVNFPTTPKRFPVSPKVRVIHLGADIALKNLQHKFEHNEDLNRCILELWNPPLDHEVRIVWALPEVWPPT
jgi:3',5'-cyclic AMP phosphodiesterase CpdA